MSLNEAFFIPPPFLFPYEKGFVLTKRHGSIKLNFVNYLEQNGYKGFVDSNNTVTFAVLFHFNSYLLG